MQLLIAQILALALVFCLESFFPLFKTKGQRIIHAERNLGVGALNGLLGFTLFSSLLLGVMEWSADNHFGLLYRFNFHPAAKVLLAFVLFDLWMYLWHRLNHHAHFLWKFHRMHHSDTEMDSTSAVRFHFCEILISSVLRLAIVPLIGMNALEMVIYQFVLYGVIVFHHSNINLPEKYDSVLRWLIVTPNMHRVHHSHIQSETDSNYSSVFSFWDRLARTYSRRVDVDRIVFGLESFREPYWQSFKGMLLTPFINVSRSTNNQGVNNER